MKCERTDRRHRLGAVVQREALLRRELNDRNAGSLHRLFAGEQLSLIVSLAESQHDENHVRERRQIAGSAERTLLRDKGRHALVEHRNHGLKGLEAYAGVALREVIDAKQQHAARHILREGISRADRVRDDQVLLQFLALIGADDDIAELSEARRNAVDHLLLCDQIVHNLPGCQHSLPTLCGEFHDRAVAANRNNLIDAQVLSGNQNFFHPSASSYPS